MQYPFMTAAAVAAVLSLTTLVASAADPTDAGRGPMSFENLDQDGNGIVSPEEYRKAHEERIRMREENREQYQYNNRDESGRFSEMDADQDGRVSREEFQSYQKNRQEQHAKEREQRRQQMEERHQKRMEEMQEHRSGMPEGGAMPPAGMGGKR